jgi:hypothetical protein
MDHDGARPESRGRPQNRAEIVRICYLIEYDEPPRRLCPVDCVVNVEFVQGVRQQRNPLVNGIPGQSAAKGGRVRGLDPDLRPAGK